MSGVVFFVGADVDEEDLGGGLLELDVEFGGGEAGEVGGEESIDSEREDGIWEDGGEDCERDEGGNEEERIGFHGFFVGDFGTL